MPEQQQSADEKAQFAAYVGIDWADQKHVWALQVAVTGQREHSDVGHSPEAVEEWITGLMARFPVPRPAAGRGDTGLSGFLRLR